MDGSFQRLPREPFDIHALKNLLEIFQTGGAILGGFILACCFIDLIAFAF